VSTNSTKLSGFPKILALSAPIQGRSSNLPSFSRNCNSFSKLVDDSMKLGTTAHPLFRSAPSASFGTASRAVLGCCCFQVAGVAQSPIYLLTVTPLLLTLSASCWKTKWLATSPSTLSSTNLSTSPVTCKLSYLPLASMLACLSAQRDKIPSRWLASQAGDNISANHFSVWLCSSSGMVILLLVQHPLP
jgi:hypothetical protein